MALQSILDSMLETIAGITGKVEGAYNLRENGQGVERYSTENVKIVPKSDKPGIDIYVRPGTKGEQVHIPVVLTQSGLNDLVYNDFFIGEGADVTIVAGCGIHNDGCDATEHDGIHSFKIGKNAHIRYVEKHYGEGEGTGERILNPTTIVDMDEGSSCEMEMVQIAGVSSTIRKTEANLGADAKLLITERLMTHGDQKADSDVVIHLNGAGSSAQVISRSVAKDRSSQVFHPIAQGNALCHAHIQCDTILMDAAHVQSIPEIEANHPDAAIIHEAAIGRINNEQMLKLETLGLTEQEAEKIIIDAFLE